MLGNRTSDAAKAIGVRVSNADVNDVARLIQTESSGNAGVTQQIHDVNSGGNEAQGLLQYTPGSFNSYAIRGHKNIKTVMTNYLLSITQIGVLTYLTGNVVWLVA